MVSMNDLKLYWPGDSMSHAAEETVTRCEKSIIYNSQKVELTQISTGGWISNLWHI